MARKTKNLFFGSKKIQALGLILIGSIGMSLWLLHWWSMNSQFRFNQALILKYELMPVAAEKPHPTHIFIQWFLDTPIVDGVFQNNTWTVDDHKANYLIQSSRPTSPGNIIIYGHNTRQILGNIRALKGGEKITLTLSNGDLLYYQVQSVHQVSPKDVSYLEPTNHEVLTLYTCAGFADADRFVVQAVPLTSN